MTSNFKWSFHWYNLGGYAWPDLIVIKVNCMIWLCEFCFVQILFVDTAGMERYGRLTRQHYHGSHVVLLVYDCDDSDSLKELKEFYKDARDNTNGAAMVLVRNKIDKDFQSVDIAETTNLICNHHTKDICKFKFKAETSAKHNTGIEKLVNDIAEYLIKNVEPSNRRNVFQERIKLEEPRQQTPPTETSSSGCPC